ncbi:replicative DNA helicase [Saccharospirillum salsuginis]|uniref:Replicative DNA helicase n=1 Tax=Saccharospirillum salsuginis TaxID=418750 RepID=A0A918N560_9GAMM|nr:replicative DNA helicase [Saccharospirillum salsuginis]GGX38170.1 replicative DNA helicase [Saccharospirillum salsuginis]
MTDALEDDLFSGSDDLAKLKTPPHSLEAEQSVLGALMIDNSQWDNVSEILMPDDFYRNEHRQVFRMMMRLAEETQPLDVITLGELLEQEKQLEAVGGMSYLNDLAENTPSIGNLVAYAKIVQERSVLRRLISVANDIAGKAYDPRGLDAETILDDAERQVFQIAEERPNQGGLIHVNPLVEKAIQRIDDLYHSDSDITGVSTGFADLDGMTTGMQSGDLLIVAARPSMGKTTFAMNLVEEAALNQDKSVVVFSLEMPADQIITRSMASLGRIDMGRVKTGKLHEDDFPKLTKAVNLLKDRKLFIDDTPGISPTEMRSRLRRLVREHGDVGLIMVDYLQLMKIKGFTEGRTNEISEISRSLKAIAKEFECPMVALSQLNRSLEQRPNKRPVNSDLRESGAIEQDADVILFIYRDEVYNEDSKDKGTAEIIIGKQRNGPIGTCRLAFIGKHSRFENLAPDQYGDWQEE